MKICHIIFALENGGSENMLVDIANEQVKQSDVYLLIINNRVNTDLLSGFNKQVKITRINRKEGNKRNLLPVLKIWKWLFKVQPHIIHCHNHALIKFLYFWHDKTAITVHDVGMPVHNIRKYGKVFAISESVRKDLYERGRITSSVIYNGIHFDLIRRRNEYVFDNTREYRILQVSRLNHQKKGQHVALDAFKKLKDLGNRNIQLYFVGDGPSMSYLKSLSVDLGINESVHFLGEKNRSWIFENLCHFDLLIQPSVYEGFGLAIIEGLAAGLPVVASRIDGPEEILEGIPGTLLFRAGDTDDLVASIQNIIGLTKENKIGSACQAAGLLINPRYSIVHTAHEYLRHYAN